MMDSRGVELFLRLDKRTGRVFKGFAARDSPALPGTRLAGERCLYVLNTDTEEGRGEHWCVFYAEGDRGDFFDSYGLPPTLYGFEPLLATSGVRWIGYNGRCVQAFGSSSCAYFCLYFAHFRCAGRSMRSVLLDFDEEDAAGNERVVARFVLAHGSAYALTATAVAGSS